MSVCLSILFSPEPCPPTNVTVQYNVGAAQVLWGPARGASSYSVQAVPDQGSTVTCSTNSTRCLFDELQCGRIYNLTVVAHNAACASVASQSQQLMTGESQSLLAGRSRSDAVLMFAFFADFQSPAHLPTSRPGCSVSSRLPPCPGSRKALPWVTLPTWMT